MKEVEDDKKSVSFEASKLSYMKSKNEFLFHFLKFYQTSLVL